MQQYSKFDGLIFLITVNCFGWFHITHRIHVWYISLLIYHTNQPTVGKYTWPLNPGLLASDFRPVATVRASVGQCSYQNCCRVTWMKLMGECPINATEKGKHISPEGWIWWFFREMGANWNICGEQCSDSGRKFLVPKALGKKLPCKFRPDSFKFQKPLTFFRLSVTTENCHPWHVSSFSWV